MSPQKRSEAEQWKSFGQYLKRERTRRGWTKVDAAVAAGISSSTWSTLESGGRRYRGEWTVPSPNDVRLVKIAKALTVDPEEVFREAGREWTGQVDPATPSPSGSRGEWRAEVAELNARLSRVEALLEELLAAPRPPRRQTAERAAR